MIPERIGKRIATLRQELGWTQRALAERVAISRVAISHIEADISVPSERTITLLAGVFKTSPHELVAGTTYPEAKMDRLPLVVCSYTELELDLALMENDLAWVDRLGREGKQRWVSVQEHWRERLERWREGLLDEQEKARLGEAWERLRGSEVD